MAAQPNAWICCVCGHIHIGDEQPGCCVLCGAGSDVFEPHQEETTPEMPAVAAQWRCLICDYVAEVMIKPRLIDH